MIILGIETSCDETAVAILKISRNNSEILNNFVFSQIKIHRRFGGVVPKIAGREHLKKIIPLLNEALQKSKIKPKDIDLIAITRGPGLAPSLFVGMSAAKTLSYVWQKPIVGVNHIEAHLFANFVCEKVKSMEFPAIGLIVSGGHTQLILIKDFLKYKVLGETLDDAAGECFDKTARILGLSYPGGPAIAEQAAKLEDRSWNLEASLPRPMINSKNFDFSFSGLKTAVLYQYQKSKISAYGGSLPAADTGAVSGKKYIQEMSWKIQQAIIDVLISKTIKAAEKYQAKIILLGGGVIANKELRKQFREKIKKEKLSYELRIPSLKFCGDNAAMIAFLGFYYFNAGEIDSWENLKIKPDLRLI
jgi:N6-L-threonylcarbamoyladenine synthase